jgi:hypothetical protein
VIVVSWRRVVGEARLWFGVSLISYFLCRVFVLLVVCFSSNKNYDKSLIVPLKKIFEAIQKKQR